MQLEMSEPAELPLRCAPQVYYERDSSIIPSRFWPAYLIDLAQARAIPEHKLLRHTGIFCEDIHRPDHRICPEQVLQLIQNVTKNTSADDLSFLVGHQLLPGKIAVISDQLMSSTNLDELIDALVEHQAFLSPLINIRRCYEGDALVLYWQDACGAEDSFIFLVEALTTAISSLARWLSNSRLPWQFYFSHKAPTYIEQYEVHLGGNIHFDCQRNAMAIAREYCYQPWVKNADITAEIFTDHSTNIIEAPTKGFLASVYDYLNSNIATDPNLEQTAADFGMSSASFKRKLKKHRSHFQAIYDQVRKDLAVYWINQEGWSSEQVAKKLHFHDVANLRRAFKKWTGLTLMKVRN
jgi:AraC-like DNA-binding protein